MEPRKKILPALFSCLLAACVTPQPYRLTVKDMVDLGKTVPDEYVVTLEGDRGVTMQQMKGFFQARAASQCGKGRIYRLRHWKEHTDPPSMGGRITVTGHIECIRY